MTASVYIAGSSQALERARLVAERIESLCTVTFPHPWWTLPGIGHDAGLSKDQRASVSAACKTMIAECDVFLLLYPNFACHSSCFTEYGFALAMSEHGPDRYPHRVMVSGPSASLIAFGDDAGAIRFHDDESAIASLVAYVNKLNDWRSQLREESP